MCFENWARAEVDVISIFEQPSPSALTFVWPIFLYTLLEFNQWTNANMLIIKSTYIKRKSDDVIIIASYILNVQVFNYNILGELKAVLILLCLHWPVELFLDRSTYSYFSEFITWTKMRMRI